MLTASGTGLMRRPHRPGTRSLSRTRLSTIPYILVPAVLLAFSAANGKTVNQVLFRDPSGPIVVQKFTRSFPSATLEVSLDQETYLVDQRIETIICVENRGGRVLEHLAPLHPGFGYLVLKLRNTGTGKALPAIRERALLAVDGVGRTLKPGESECETLNLLYWFGSRKPTRGIAYCLQSATLPAGSYTLDAEYRMRLGGNGAEEQVVLRAVPVEFTIAPLTSDPQEAERVREFTEGCSVFRNDGDAVGRHCVQWLSRFERSPYYLLVYYNTRRLMPSIPIDTLLKALDARGEDGRKQAALIALRCKIEPLSPDERIRWLDGLRAKRRDPLAQRVLNTWKRRYEDSTPK
jgi:hypothetical protein